MTFDIVDVRSLSMTNLPALTRSLKPSVKSDGISRSCAPVAAAPFVCLSM